MNDSGIGPLRGGLDVDERTATAMLALNRLAGMIKIYDPALYVCIEEIDDVALGAQSIAAFYGLGWAADMNIIRFCAAVRDKIIERHGLGSLPVVH